jgi:hypothetical protein
MMFPLTLTLSRKGRGAYAGQTLVMFAIVLAFLLVGLLALTADLGALFTAYTRADNVALLAAQAGASQIDQNAFYNGQIILDSTEAPKHCHDAVVAGRLPQSAFSSNCMLDATKTAMTVDIKFNAQLPLPLPGTSAPIHVTETAQTVYGDTTGRIPKP